MNAGTKLDALIAEKVFGCTVSKILDYGIPGNYRFRCDCPGANSINFRPHSDGGLDEDIKQYSTDIAAAWEVVEKVDLLSKLSLERFEGKYILVKYLPGYDNDFVIVSESERAPHAICLAVLELQKLVN